MRIFACFASSLDGKIHPGKVPPHGPSGYMRMSSDEDIRHLMALRDEADALVMGAQTFRAYPRRHKSRNPEHRPWHVILTRGRNLERDIPPDAPLFADTPDIPVMVVSCRLPEKALMKRYGGEVRWIRTRPGHEVSDTCQALERIGCRDVMVEGGGEVLDLFLREKAVQELYLTLCPLLLGGRDTPALLAGEGFSLTDAPRTEILNLQQRGNELYLHLGLQYP